MGTLKPGPEVWLWSWVQMRSPCLALVPGSHPKIQVGALKLIGGTFGEESQPICIWPIPGRLSRVQEVAHRGCADEFACP